MSILSSVSTCCNNNIDLYLDGSLNWQAHQGGFARKIASVGAVSGLGAITTAPSAGFANSAAAINGHGYVLQDNGKL